MEYNNVQFFFYNNRENNSEQLFCEKEVKQKSYKLGQNDKMIFKEYIVVCGQGSEPRTSHYHLNTDQSSPWSEGGFSASGATPNGVQIMCMQGRIYRGGMGWQLPP